jgi:hypothetical protein
MCGIFNAENDAAKKRAARRRARRGEVEAGSFAALRMSALWATDQALRLLGMASKHPAVLLKA